MFFFSYEADPRRCEVFGASSSTLSERVNVPNVRLAATAASACALDKKILS